MLETYFFNYYKQDGRIRNYYNNLEDEWVSNVWRMGGNSLSTRILDHMQKISQLQILETYKGYECEKVDAPSSLLNIVVYITRC